MVLENMSLSKKELQTLINLLKKVKPTSSGLPEEVFNAIMHLVPFIALELVLINSKKEILLTWREDKYWRGWHFPGGLLRYRESFDKRIKETAQRELGVKVKSFKFLFPKNYVKGSRTHDVSLVFLIKSSNRPKDGKFFAHIPKDIITEHRELWKKVQSYI
ncbi:MAG: hypothetical protein A2826_00080 [Candidatus Doudnabacteria bacterium RIFCSPHIGHO2_01_FULL_43_23]|uniref:Nudix hydrolase domain-containing protein n=1 Tax=Candidatus Doudnabacteria bacterium RIFCSPHIGHO2_01_FULL_43_23 TaxID=1817822 RepID=A0A1F5NQW9_9BACT|nr:MAG: hypothetical protein A2826_00080 [Candidatus Doudnabacteria bacterium RIFCSPHIGHO2_01_FULL_43_23]